MAAPTPRRKTTARKASGRVTPRKATLTKINGAKKGTPIPDGTLRLLKVRVQPVYALDTPDGLIEVAGVPVEEVNGAGWLEWATKQFTPEALEERRAELTILDPQ